MNIELDEIVVQDVSDDELEQTVRGAQWGTGASYQYPCPITAS